MRANLVLQWNQEVLSHCSTKTENKPNGIGNVYMYSGGNGLDSNCTESLFASADIVLTTWDQIKKSYPKAAPPKELTTEKQKVSKVAFV